MSILITSPITVMYWATGIPTTAGSEARSSRRNTLPYLPACTYRFPNLKKVNCKLKNKDMTTFIKTTVSILAFAITTSQLKAQESDGMLSDAYKSLETATGMGNLMAAENKFTLIAAKWSNDWAANYYAAYAAIYISLQ